MIELKVFDLVVIILGTVMVSTLIYSFLVASGKASREEEKREN